MSVANPLGTLLWQTSNAIHTSAADAPLHSILTPVNNCDRVCPNAIGSGQWSLWVLAVLYYFIAVGSVSLIVSRCLAVRSLQLTSFRSIFLVLAFCFSFLRGVLVTFNFSWVVISLIFVGQLLPVFFQFAMFSLLIVFLAKCQYMMQDNDSIIRKFLYPIYIGILVVFFLISVIMAFIIAENNDPDDHRVLTRGFDRDIAIYSSIVFGTLFILVCTYGYRTYKLVLIFSLSKKKERKVRRFAMVALLYLVVLVARVLWDVTYLAGINIAQQQMNDMIIDSNNDYFICMLVFYFVVDIVPTGAILLAFYCWLPNRPAAEITVTETQRSMYGATPGYSTFGTNHDEPGDDD
ncbi:hypothetical protein CAOG_03328 [Capsaspora owczarzaki ATCC 30864]|nr:hypothetical protein CAOG_03328 [Capsaspora owczarzaki ATCC 30864]|eukprot:XP_004364167.1 hypothetical protein CAOG_03328 [Capsaspora owczarzaki ATCC 30864]